MPNHHYNSLERHTYLKKEKRNDKQKTKLIELAIKFNLNEIVYVARSEWSGHREKIKVIWSKNDVL